jgi:hypothetical protein
MTRTEFLDKSVGFPLELPKTIFGHSGVPTSVAERFAEAKLWHLVAWNDEVSATIGLARGTSLVIFERSEITGLSINFLRPAKGRGWVELAAQLRNQRATIPVLQSNSFGEAALGWLMDRKGKIEALFDIEISVNDGGFDW